MVYRAGDQGFEKEEVLCRLFRQSLLQCPSLDIGTLCNIVLSVAPGLMSDLFKIRPFERKLRYVGFRHAETPAEWPYRHFTPGHTYEAIDYNGGSYSIKGYEGKRFGCAFFEVVGEGQPATEVKEQYGGAHGC